MTTDASGANVMERERDDVGSYEDIVAAATMSSYDPTSGRSRTMMLSDMVSCGTRRSRRSASDP